MSYFEGEINNQEFGIGILGMGYYVPKKVIKNDYFDIERITPEKIIRVTGIEERRRCEETESTSDMAYCATQKALKDAGISAEELDMIIVATATPDYKTPPTANLLQQKLNIEGRPCFDLNSGGCANSIFGLITGIQYAENNPDKTILVIMAETFKGLLDDNERTAVYFGDGASAMIIGKVEKNKGFIAYNFQSITKDSDALIILGGGSKTPLTNENLNDGLQYLFMDGRSVLNFATTCFPESVSKLLSSTDYNINDIDFLIAHQANINIIKKGLKKIGLSQEKTYTTIERYGNTSGASVGITLNEAYNKGKIQDGHTVVLSGFGAGLAFGSILLKL